jgi:predicted RNA binding protein YcfA (HicA-like mRNA interferase family)
MSKWSKLYESLLRNPDQSVRFADLERLLEAFGFAFKRSKGSHRSYKHVNVPFVLTIQPHGKEAVPYQVKRLLEVVRDFDLHMEV